VVLDLAQSILNLILGLFVLRMGQLALTNRVPDSDFNKALAFLLH
jgi:hypothetical protein